MADDSMRSSSLPGPLSQEQGEAPEENAGYEASGRYATSGRSLDLTESRRLSQFNPGVEADMPQGEVKDNKDVYTSSKIAKEGFENFEELRQKGQLCDVVIKVEDNEYHAHRLVLAGTCPYFRVMFTGECDIHLRCARLLKYSALVNIYMYFVRKCLHGWSILHAYNTHVYQSYCKTTCNKQ